MTDEEIIAVVQAHKEGKQIESRNNDTYCPWMDDHCYSWDFKHLDYRVKPEPRKPREWEAQLSNDGKIIKFSSPILPGYGRLGAPKIRLREVLE